MIMEASIAVEYKGKKYWVNSGYWNSTEDSRIVLRMENGDAWNESLTEKMVHGCNFIDKTEVKLWEEPRVEDYKTNHKIVIPMKYEGRKVYVSQYFWEDFKDTGGSISERDISGNEIGFLEISDLRMWKETPENMVAVRWSGKPNKIHYVSKKHWDNPHCYELALYNRKGEHRTDVDGKYCKKTTTELSVLWFFAPRSELEVIE